MKPGAPIGFRWPLHYYGVLLSVCTLTLLFIGGMVTSTYSGLSVPDWPTTFGQNMFTFPPSMMKGGIFYEHGHRLFASLVGFLTIGNSLALWIWDRRRWLQWTGVFALLLVIVQGVLGGMTVRYKLPMPVSAAHACVAELFLCITVLMAFATSKAWIFARPGFREMRPGGVRTLRDAFPAGLQRSPEQVLVLGFWAAIFMQILAGAVMRHSHAGLAIPSFPAAFGQFIPPFWNFGITVNFLHTRVGGSLLVVLGGLLAARIGFSPRQPRAVKGLALLLALLLGAQCVLGMLAIWSGKAAVPTTVHLAMGALVFALSFLTFLAVSRLQGTGADRSEVKAAFVNPIALLSQDGTVSPSRVIPT